MTARARALAASASLPGLEPSHAWRMIGLMTVALTCAAFWTGLVALVGALAGTVPGGATLTMTAAGIAGFLTLACAPLMFADSGHD
jgi:hypothetical protein